MTFKAPTYDADLFTWLPRERKFVSELSTIQDYDLSLHHYGAFYIRNPKTKGVAIFKWYGTDKDREGETLCYRFKNDEHNLTAVLYND